MSKSHAPDSTVLALLMIYLRVRICLYLNFCVVSIFFEFSLSLIFNVERT